MWIENENNWVIVMWSRSSGVWYGIYEVVRGVVEVVNWIKDGYIRIFGWEWV